MKIDLHVQHPDLLVGAAIARGVSVAPAPAALVERLDELIARRAQEAFPPPPLKDAVRNLLRQRGFAPTGRSKPSSEYLANAAREGRFPRINNLVDINNLLSLEWGLPMSLLDLDAVGPHAEIRLGREGESYVFNSTGQEIKLTGLVCVCRVDGGDSTPLGNPVKDSMAGKLKDTTAAVLGIIYGSAQVMNRSTMEQYTAEFAHLLREYGGATSVEQQVLAGG
jgi:DNA/RNA-binding domain of Phe-tRNA-synthetase-like protein